MDDSIEIEVEGFLFDHFPADEHFKMRESCEKIFLEWHKKKVLQAKQKMDDEMQDYYGLANVTIGFVALKPEHPLYDSIRQDVLNYLSRVKGDNNG